MKSPTEKLSKRAGDPSFEDLLSMGYLVDAVVNYIALLGWSPGGTEEIFSLNDLIKEFSLEGLSKSPAIFDINKLNWLNGEYIRKMSQEDFYEVALPFISQGIKNKNIDLKKVSNLLQARTEVLGQIPATIDFFDELPEYDTAMYIHKKMKTNEEISLDSLRSALEILKGVTEWNNQNIFDSLMALAASKEIKNSQILWPVRTAVSGKQVTPGGATEIAEILGKEETIRRIETGIGKLEKVLQ
jgi:glutamyl-tRNA synthetase